MITPRRGLPAGIGFALASALLFGLSTPCAKLLLGGIPPLLLAGLLYAGSGLGLTLLRLVLPASTAEAPLTRADCFRQTSKDAPVDLAGDEPIGEAAAPRLDKLIEQAEMSACVSRFIEALPDAQRRVLLLHDIHGLTGPEMARLCGSSLDAVKIRLHRARRGLQAALTGGCDFSRDERDVLVCSPKSPPDATPRRAPAPSRSSRER